MWPRLKFGETRKELWKTMHITVILTTYNRCQTLATTMDSVAASMLPDSVKWEVVVVDNNSSDQTHEFVKHFSCRHPGRFRYVFEPKQGVSHARNAGVREARGDVIVFVDDDVTAGPMWLQNLTAALSDSQWAGAGGRILPERAFSTPRWLALEEKYALAPLPVFDLGPEAGQLAEPPFGTNMAFRKAMFEKYGAFRTDLDRCGTDLLSNGDTEFGRRLLDAGERLRYEPSAVIYHPVVESRLRKKYFLAWWCGKGRSDIREFGIPPGAECCWGIPLYMFRRLARWTLCWMVAVEPSRRFSCKRKVWGLVGQIVESYRQRQMAEAFE